MKKIDYITSLLLLLLMVATLLPSCSGKRETQKPMVTVTIEPLRYITQQIAGDRLEVISLVPAGSSPETYDPTPRQMTDMARSVLYLQVGRLGFEKSWSKSLAQTNPALKIIDTSAGVSYIGDDPHVWCSAANVLIIAGNVYHSLCDLSPVDSLLFRQNYEKFRNAVVQVDSLVRHELASLKNRAFLIYHPALTYFARDYALKQICIEEEGKEPTTAQMAALIDTCKRLNVKRVLVQQEFDVENARAIAAELGGEAVVISPLNYQWDREMLHTAALLKEKSHE